MDVHGIVALDEQSNLSKWIYDASQHPFTDLTMYPHQVGGHGTHGKESGETYLCLKDVLVGIRRPTVCDIKIGQRTYAPDAPAEKIAVERSKYKWQTDLGFCITGMKVYHPASCTPIYLDRYYGRSLSPDTVYEHGVRLFLGSDLTRSRRLARAFVSRLNQLAEWFERQHKLSFYASSLLLAYESTTHSDDSSNGLVTLDDSKEHVVAYLIDFTRWRPLFGGARDENFLYGLRRLMELLQRASTDTSASVACDYASQRSSCYDYCFL
ncbi:unnamed protein product [Dicrocoelium dendriticum]|nr:unnamed protein product [Dicrocoelium dendriticum]